MRTRPREIRDGCRPRTFYSAGFSRKIVVPFCPESRLSGIGHTDFIEAMWYQRSIAIPKSWADKLIFINLGGVDYECEIFVDKKMTGILTPHRKTGVFRNVPDKEPPYEGQPYLVDEYGGIKWIPPGRRAYADNSCFDALRRQVPAGLNIGLSGIPW